MSSKSKSPFRIKRNHIVAVRKLDSVKYKGAPLNLTAFRNLWTPCTPNDRSLSLVGKRIRISYPNRTMKVLEGDVLAFDERSNRVIVRIPQFVFEAFKDVLKLLSDSHYSKLELQIRGATHVCARAKLPAQFVVQRMVPPKLKCEPTKYKQWYVGDGNDHANTQAENWRWLCANYGTMKAPSANIAEQVASLGLFGRVLDIDTEARGTLAQLTIERVFYRNNEWYQDFQQAQFKVPIEMTSIVQREIESPQCFDASRDYILPRETTSDGVFCILCRRHEDLWEQPSVAPNRCRECRDPHAEYQHSLQGKGITKAVDFGLSRDFWSPLPDPSPKIRTAVATKKRKRSPVPRRKDLLPRVTATKTSTPVMIEEDYSVFKPTCAREQGLRRTTFRPTPANVRPRNLRQQRLDGDRTARKNQRRLQRSFAECLDFDQLKSREAQLRFDRSPIHAWGVFCDAPINAGELIVEYRGELIGNALAEKREKEYHKAKFSDYMFRIDETTVCDATKQGNVARFINASCDPNCYTKILTVGTKRIAIYAKKDIPAGEELSYDYKFQFELDPSKRIPCYCGAKDCRGFMNWDKRYVGVTPDASETGSNKPVVGPKATISDSGTDCGSES